MIGGAFVVDPASRSLLFGDNEATMQPDDRKVTLMLDLTWV
jgi:hypothetical protein